MVWSKPRFEAVERLLAEVPDHGAPGTRCAAVAVVLRETERDLEVLFIRRAERAGDPWSGHVALPGGHFDARDADLLATARRETLEEVGLDLSRSARLLGRLDDLRPMSGLALDVRPFLFALEAPVDLRLSDEVDEAFWAELGPLALGHHDARYDWQRGNMRVALPAWDLGGKIVWGMTYRLLSDLLARLRSAPGA